MPVFAQTTTPDGPFSLIAADDGAVLSSGWTDSIDELQARLRTPVGAARGTSQAIRAVEAYYDGDHAPILRVAVRQDGTALQHQGWDALREVTPGRPLSYSEFAAALGRPTAVRAAASICARNAAALFVPCHRVLRSDGSLGGFAWGETVKRSLLSREVHGRPRA
ncbi:methylated-DNA--[protein]-cysteine S-methyltransferase [Microbacterium amylolyticum]|uniref:Methylated-DNA-[protein]-cysteine S-methyltransferase n=1 Tax=Microbacterium amylolyticum TaxID=936337 RepID=A0ABS4ZJJ2_9MICO|nr:methylated-DNA--[protein]-cysteine S-methyltransferase [Microbacterium amylolyticum]MBP2437452.1 methylated-DNA-[protein]-cysteine S-methyltransferase [Microbacterium amylolyticum]